MKKLMTLAAAGMLIAGIGAITAVNAAETTVGTTTTKTLKNGLTNGLTNGLKNGATNGAKTGLKNGTTQGSKKRTEERTQRWLEERLEERAQERTSQRREEIKDKSTTPGSIGPGAVVSADAPFSGHHRSGIECLRISRCRTDYRSISRLTNMGKFNDFR
ncbi:MAG: hypothetical protein L6W00_18000 [Lentisphaeria bacterium]|nr:MAG: hypothetical protein L6W00_18000 [Lentisphaeria bacterium]